MKTQNKKQNHFVPNIAILVVTAILSACGPAPTTGSASSNTSIETLNCVASDNDFYVVENAACTKNAGKLTRVNPDESCKEEILTNLDCPVDFVLSDNGETGYLSLQTNDAVGGVFDDQPGEI